MAQPVFNPDDPLGGDGPLMLVVDNGWGAGPHWKERQEEMANLIDRAGREGRQVIILTTAATPDGSGVTGKESCRKPDATAVGI